MPLERAPIPVSRVLPRTCRSVTSRIDALHAYRRRLRPPPSAGRRVGEAYLRSKDWLLPAAVAVTGSALAAVIVGDALTVSPSRAIVVVYFVLAFAALARLGLLGVGLLLAATQPWLIVAGDRLPRLTETFAAGALTAVVILVVAPRSDGSERALLLRVGIVCFYAPVLLSLGREGSGEQFIQAAKYVVFPAIVLAVTEATHYRSLMSLRTAVLWSGIAAVAVNLLLGLTGFAAGRYGAGEIVGLGGAHDVALLAGCLTAAFLAESRSFKSAPAIAVGAIATVATGVRSTLPGLAVLAIGRMIVAGARIRTMVLVALALVAVFASGAADVVEARFKGGESGGEFESFSALGSGRGEIYATAVDSWRDASPVHWFIGTGLRSIPRFEKEKLGAAFVGHSDVVEVGVQLGIVGFIGLIMIWWVLFVSARSKAPLLVLASVAVFNGSLEYSGALVIGVLLTAGARRDHHDVPTSILRAKQSLALGQRRSTGRPPKRA
jgi:O-Antigen ligase